MDSYTVHVLYANFRLLIVFCLLFVWIAPNYFKHLKSYDLLDRIIQSWVGFGGMLLLILTLLSLLHINDVISVLTTLVIIFIVKNIREDAPENVIDYLTRLENRVVYSHIKLIENLRFGKPLFKRTAKRFSSNKNYVFLFAGIFLVVLIGGAYIYRILPVFTNAEPLSREWFFNVNRVKEIRIQNYFGDNPSPAGMFVLIDFLSQLINVEPELILHITGIWVNAWIMVIIFWVIKKIINKTQILIPLTGSIIYAFVSTQFFSIPPDYYIEANTLMLAISFAIPVLMIGVNDHGKHEKNTDTILLLGIVAIGITNLFVFFVTFIFVITQKLIFALYRKSSIYKYSYRYVIWACIIIVVIYGKYMISNNANLSTFIKGQLFATNMYSISPGILYPFKTFSIILLGVAGILVVYNVIYLILNKKYDNLSFLNFTILFIILTFIYVYEKGSVNKYVDYDQLNPFYIIFLSVFLSVMIYYMYRYIVNVFDIYGNGEMILQSVIVVFVLLISVNLIHQPNPFSKASHNLPNSFLKSYYEINRDYLPYSYTIVAPSIDSSLAKNRHYFMDYGYFLSDYRKLDSLYRGVSFNKIPKKLKNIQTTNLFIYVENPPFKWLPEGILPDQKKVMSEMRKWVMKYKTNGYTELTLFYHSREFNVYELINNKQLKSGKSILFNKILKRKKRDVKQ